jgi:hypothetical protein
MVAAARNLSTIMRMICGIGSPRALQGLRALLQGGLDALWSAHIGVGKPFSWSVGYDATVGLSPAAASAFLQRRQNPLDPRAVKHVKYSDQL